MRIRTKISLLVTLLTTVVVGSIVLNLLVVEQRRLRQDFSARVDALMEGVLRIANESLSTQDELMLLSYLKFLMKDYPEIELAVVSRQDHSSLLGGVRSELFYRTLTLRERRAAEFKQAAEPPAPAAPRPAGAAPTAQAPLPKRTFTIQLGFSKTLLDRQIRDAQRRLAGQILAIAGVGLLLGVGGSLWLGRLLARPVSALSEAAQRIGEGRLDTAVEAAGRDEIGNLGRQFNRMTAKLRDLIQFKEDLLSTLSHELNTPLSGLKGFLEYLQDSEGRQDAKDRRESYETMSEAIRQMEISLSNALQLFKTDTRPSLQLERLRINDVLGEVLRLFAPMAKSNGITLEGRFGPAPVHIRGDKEMMRRVFINLVSNALKYTAPGGSVRIDLVEDGAQVQLSVADTGPGIAPQYQDKIFTKFYRAPGPDGSPQRIPGSGLGLAIAKQAVELQNGRIWLKSEVGKGSVFLVSIPRQAGDDA